MARLTAKTRNALPAKSFAGPHRSYPIEDASHARNALARVSQHGTASLKAAVRAKVHRKYPGISIGKMHGGNVPHRQDRASRGGGRGKG